MYNPKKTPSDSESDSSQLTDSITEVNPAVNKSKKPQKKKAKVSVADSIKAQMLTDLHRPLWLTYQTMTWTLSLRRLMVLKQGGIR